MIIIKQTERLSGWHNILLSECQVEVDWMHVLAVGAGRKSLIKHDKHVALCTGYCNHLSTIFIKEIKQVPSSCNFFLLLLLPCLTVFWKIHLQVQLHGLRASNCSLFSWIMPSLSLCGWIVIIYFPCLQSLINSTTTTKTNTHQWHTVTICIQGKTKKTPSMTWNHNLYSGKN